jgi:hypothetical protein
MPHSQSDLRPRLVDIALTWQQQFGVAPSITSAVSEYDAAAIAKVPVYGLTS